MQLRNYQIAEIERLGKTMPRGVYPRNKKVTKKQSKHNGRLVFAKEGPNDALLKALAIANSPGEIIQSQLDMPFDKLTQEVDKALGLSKVEEVNHPAHYGGDSPMEVIKVLEFHLTREEFIGAMKFNIVKYNLRAGKKIGVAHIVDINKAAFYQNYLKEFLGKV